MYCQCMYGRHSQLLGGSEKSRHDNTGNSIIVDGCTNESAIAQLFASKYRSLYYCVSFDKDEMQHFLNELDGKVCDDKLYYANCCFTDLCVSITITKLNAHKNDDKNAGLSTDHLIHAGTDLSRHISFLFTYMATQGSVPSEFGDSTILSIPKSHNSNEFSRHCS